MKYFVKWKEYPVEHNSWEPEESFEHAQELLQAYKRRTELAELDIAQR